MSERGVMTVIEDGKRVELIPFVGIKPKAMANILTRYFKTPVSYEKRERKAGGGGVA